MLDLDRKAGAKLAEAHKQRVQRLRDQDIATLKADKDFGGANYDATIKASQSSMTQFFGEDGAKILKASGLDNHPSIVKGLARIRKAIAEDTTAPPTTNPAPAGGQRPTSQSQRGAGIYSDPKVVRKK